jgi:Tfp pilus assembly protein PilF
MVLYKMAVDLDMKGETTQALSQALKAEQLNPKNPDIHNLLGLMFMRKQMYERAEKYFKDALSLDETFSEARTNLSFLYIEKNMLDKAIEEGLRAVENITYTSPERAYNNIGYAYYKKGDLVQAKEYYKKSLLHNGQFYLAHRNLGILAFEAGDYRRARSSFETSIKGCGQCGFLYYDLGKTLLKLNDRKGAVESFESCVEKSNNEEFKSKCESSLAALK